MPITQLSCRDLAPGDVLLKQTAGAFSSKLITLGQKASQAVMPSQQRGLNPDIVHAGIMFDNHFIIEAQRAGLVGNDLRVQHADVSYNVFRCRSYPVAQGAGTCVKMLFDINQKRTTMPYDFLGAVGSLFGKAGEPKSQSAMDDLLTRVLEGRSHPFFCSQFVVYVYQFVAEQNGVSASSFFAMSDAKATPSLLASKLATSPNFDEIGYLMAKER